MDSVLSEQLLLLAGVIVLSLSLPSLMAYSNERIEKNRYEMLLSEIMRFSDSLNKALMMGNGSVLHENVNFGVPVQISSQANKMIIISSLGYRELGTIYSCSGFNVSTYNYNGKLAFLFSGRYRFDVRGIISDRAKMTVSFSNGWKITFW
ncbi:MAG: hypothetical protein ACP5JF_03430 [Candidatus Methanodesulfokora sp.]|jgi:hypothetical protein